MAKVKAKAKAKAPAKAKAKAPAKGAAVKEILKGKPKFKTMPNVAAGPATPAPVKGKSKPATKPTPKSKGVSMVIPAQVLPIGDAGAIAPEMAEGMDKVAAAVMAGVDPQAQAAEWTAPHPVGATVRVPIELVDMNPAHNGRELKPEKVKEYAADYAKRIAAGTEPQLQECTGFYRQGEAGGKLRLVFGFHRAAAVEAYNNKYAKTGVPITPMQLRVRIVDEMTAAQALLDNWAENKHHNALTPVAEMRYMVRLRDTHGMEQKAIAKTLGVSPTLVSLRLLLERLDGGVLKLVEEGTLPVKSAYMLAGIEDEGKRAAAVEKVAAVFAGLGDEGVVKGLKLPKTSIVAQAVAEATGANVDVSQPQDVAQPQAPPATPVDPAPKRLAAGKIETTLVNVVKSEAAPAEVRTVLRAVLGWVLGQRTAPAMVNVVAKALGYSPKTFDAAAVVSGAGAGAVIGTVPSLLDGVPAVQVQGAGAGDMAPAQTQAPAAE